MKEIVKKELIKVPESFKNKVTIKYESFDGNEFDSRFQCEHYESEKRKNEVNTELNVKNLESNLSDIFPIDGFNSYTCKLSNNEDFNLLYDTYCIDFNHRSVEGKFTKKGVYFFWVDVYDGGCYQSYILHIHEKEDLKSKFNDFLSKLS